MIACNKYINHRLRCRRNLFFVIITAYQHAKQYELITGGRFCLPFVDSNVFAILFNIPTIEDQVSAGALRDEGIQVLTL